MVWATPDAEGDMRDVMLFTGLTRKALVQAMSNERKRYRAEGYTDDDLKALRASNGLVLKLDDACEALSMCIQTGSLPPGVDQRLKRVVALVVWIITPCSRYAADLIYRLRRQSCIPVRDSTFQYRLETPLSANIDLKTFRYRSRLLCSVCSLDTLHFCVPSILVINSTA
jgi:hypothetical protein